MLTLESFKSARSVLQAVLRPTPLIHSPYLSKNCRNNVYLKPENLYNLCSNALRYNQRGGKVTVTADTENGRVFLSVKDTGIGIPREHQERIFERFYRVDKSRSRQNGGTGLGLAIVKHIVAQHSAEIMLESEPGKGTEIRVLF